MALSRFNSPDYLPTQFANFSKGLSTGPSSDIFLLFKMKRLAIISIASRPNNTGLPLTGNPV